MAVAIWLVTRVEKVSIDVIELQPSADAGDHHCRPARAVCSTESAQAPRCVADRTRDRAERRQIARSDRSTTMSMVSDRNACASGQPVSCGVSEINRRRADLRARRQHRPRRPARAACRRHRSGRARRTGCPCRARLTSRPRWRMPPRLSSPLRRAAPRSRSAYHAALADDLLGDLVDGRQHAADAAWHALVRHWAVGDRESASPR